MDFTFTSIVGWVQHLPKQYSINFDTLELLIDGVPAAQYSYNAFEEVFSVYTEDLYLFTEIKNDVLNAIERVKYLDRLNSQYEQEQREKLNKLKAKRLDQSLRKDKNE